jgi:hypothetical protein
MPEIVADPPSPSCYRLFPRLGIEESQQLGPDLFLPRARHARALRTAAPIAVLRGPVDTRNTSGRHDPEHRVGCMGGRA